MSILGGRSLCLSLLKNGKMQRKEKLDRKKKGVCLQA